MTNVAPEVTAILAVHNGARFLPAALDSILRQTVLPAELIAVDDGSDDGSGQFIESLNAPFPVKVLYQSNRGQSSARNEAVRHAGGKYLAFLDQDDVWRPAHLEVLLATISAADDIGWAYSDFDEVDGQGRIVTRGFIAQSGATHPKQSLTQCLTGDLMILPSASILRTAAFCELGGFDEQLCGYEDDDLFLRFFRADWRSVFVPEALIQFRIHASSSSAGGSFLRSRLAYLDKLVDTVEDDRRLNRFWVRDLVAPRFFHSCLEDYVQALVDGDDEAAREAADAARRVAKLLPPSRKRAAELRLLDRPELCLRTLRALDALPINRYLPLNQSLRLHGRTRRGSAPKEG
jgi:glycosyltransferase involved in cell wall biosynthesis